ncbi:MAG TPA: DUF4124 domain-containing protein [Gammaproteobacteria bacterium]|nr:DUF4124 domain-containing protein [Gammaproteobacteria bacterium]
MRISLLVMIFFMCLPVSAEVYRSVDEDGNVIFSDQPSPGAEEIRIDKIQTIDAPSVKSRGTGSLSSDKKDDSDEYTSVAIQSPGSGEAISANDGNITVSVSVAPKLKVRNGHQVVVYLDGNEATQGTSMQFNLENLNRGSHSLSAAVVDGKGNEKIRSAPISFTIHRHSVQHKPPTTGPTGGKPAPNP